MQCAAQEGICFFAHAACCVSWAAPLTHTTIYILSTQPMAHTQTHRPRSSAHPYCAQHADFIAPFAVRTAHTTHTTHSDKDANIYTLRVSVSVSVCDFSLCLCCLRRAQFRWGAALFVECCVFCALTNCCLCSVNSAFDALRVRCCACATCLFAGGAPFP